MKNWFVFEKATCAYTEQITEEKLQEIVRRIEADYPITYSWKMTQKGFKMRPVPSVMGKERQAYPVLIGKVENGQITVYRTLGELPWIWIGSMGICEVVSILLYCLGADIPLVFLIWPVALCVFACGLIKAGSHSNGKPILKCVMDVLQE